MEREKGVGKAEGASEIVEYKVEIPANRFESILLLHSAYQNAHPARSNNCKKFFSQPLEI